MKQLDRISGYAHVALRYGLEEAIVLDSIMFWYKENRANHRNFRDGRWWTFNSINALAQLFPWWSAKQLRRIMESCREQKAVLAANYNEDQRDRTLWYTPGDDLLKLYGMDGDASENPSETGLCISSKGLTDLPAKASVSAQTGKCNIEHVKTHVETHEDNPLPPKTPSDEVSAVFDGYAGEDLELRERLEEFRETRKRKRKPLHTQRAAKILTGRLDKLSGGERAIKLAMLDKSILHAWDSVYALKPDELPKPPPGASSTPLRGEGVRYL